MPKRKPAPATADELLSALRRAQNELRGALLSLRKDSVVAGIGETWSLQFTGERLALVEQAIAEVSGVVLGPPGEFGLAAEAVQQAYAVGINLGTKSLTEQGITELVPPAMAELHVPAMQAIAQEMTDGYQGLYQNVLRRENDAYRRIQGHLTQVALAKGETGSELTGRLVQEFVAQLEREGRPIAGTGGRFRLPGGTRNWGIADYAEMLGRTVAAKANREAALNRIAETGHDLVIVIGGRIELTCKTCLWVDGKVLSIGGTSEKPEGLDSDLWGGPLEIWIAERSDARDEIVGMKHSPALFHPRCRLPGTRVVVPDLFTVTRAWYAGEAVELLLSSGTRLSVTANHVLLGPRGWMRADELREGDDVVYCPGLERVMGRDPQYEQVPARVEEIFTAAAMTRGMATMSMPVSAEDLHGDGRFIEGKVDVVAPTGLLRRTRPATGEKRLTDKFLHPRASDALTFAGESRLTNPFIRLGLAADGLMGGLRDTSPAFWTERRHAYPGLFAMSPALDAPVTDTPVNDALRNAEVPLEVLDAVPGGVQPCKVVSINRSTVACHVYDLHSLSTLYACNGVLSSNCIHTVGAYIETDEEKALEDLRNTLEKYAKDLGLDIANGGQAA